MATKKDWNAPVMKIVIDRDYKEEKWVMAIDNSPPRAIDRVDHEHASIHDIAGRVQIEYPRAQIGIRSLVLGTSTVAAFGSVVWLRGNLSAQRHVTKERDEE